MTKLPNASNTRRQTFFHGTSRDITGGQVLAPRSSGQPMVNRHPRAAARAWAQGEVASVSESERSAWDFAELTARRAGGRSRVYLTGRNEQMHVGYEHSRHPDSHYSRYQEWVASSWPITGRSDIKPVPRWERDTGRQGTVPMDFSAVEAHRGDYVYNLGDARGNHPSMVEQRAEAGRIAEQDKRRQAPPTKAAPKKIPGQMALPGMGRLK